MASLNISMPTELKDFVNKRTKETNHATPTEYIRSLVREDRKRADQESLERLLLEGLESGTPITVKNLGAYFDKKKAALVRRMKAGKKAKSK